MVRAFFAGLLLLTTAAGADELDLPPPPQASNAKRLDFKAGSPVIPVKLMEGSAEVTLAGRGRLRFRIAGTPEKVVEGPPGMEWKVRRTSGAPARAARTSSSAKP